MTGVLLDTNALVWLMEGDHALGAAAQSAARAALRQRSLWVSSISFCELAYLVDRGRVVLSRSVRLWRSDVLAFGIDEVPVNGDIAIAAMDHRDLPRDPADRLIVATALQLDATLLTSDARLLEWPGRLQRQDACR